MAFMLALNENIFERSLYTASPVRCHMSQLLREIIVTDAVVNDCSPPCSLATVNNVLIKLSYSIAENVGCAYGYPVT